MTDPTDARADDPKWIIDELRNEANAAASDADLPDTPTADEKWAHLVIGRSTVDYPAVVESAADELMPAVTVSPAARARFIAAAERALAARRASIGLLPVMLADTRKQAGLSLDQIQQALDAGEAAANAADLESGSTNVRDAGQEVIALWIRAARADRKAAVAAARRSLEADLGGELRPAAGTGTGTTSTEEWLTKLDAALDALDQEQQ